MDQGWIGNQTSFLLLMAEMKFISLQYNKIIIVLYIHLWLDLWSDQICDQN